MERVYKEVTAEEDGRRCQRPETTSPSRVARRKLLLPGSKAPEDAEIQKYATWRAICICQERWSASKLCPQSANGQDVARYFTAETVGVCPKLDSLTLRKFESTWPLVFAGKPVVARISPEHYNEGEAVTFASPGSASGGNNGVEPKSRLGQIG